MDKPQTMRWPHFALLLSAIGVLALAAVARHDAMAMEIHQLEKQQAVQDERIRVLYRALQDVGLIGVDRRQVYGPT